MYGGKILWMWAERKSVRNCDLKLGVMGLTGAENNVYLNGKKVLKGLKMDNSNFYIFTGGPGSGKSTVLNILSDLGYLTVREVGRDIIQKQLKTGGDALPWNNTARYARLMLLHSVFDFEEFAHINKPCFFDRGIPDTLGYCRLIHLSYPENLNEAVKEYRYNKKVFIFPPWEEIYTKDSERKQDLREARDTYRVMKEVYEEYGYRPIIVPCLPAKERAEWIISNIAIKSTTSRQAIAGE